MGANLNYSSALAYRDRPRSIGYEQSRIPICNLSRDSKTDLNRSDRNQFLNGRSPRPGARQVYQVQHQSLCLACTDDNRSSPALPL